MRCTMANSQYGEGIYVSTVADLHCGGEQYDLTPQNFRKAKTEENERMKNIMTSKKKAKHI